MFMKTAVRNHTQFPAIALSQPDRDYLEGLVSRGTHPARVVTRARILLMLDQGASVKDVNIALGSYPKTVRQIGYRYLDAGVEEALAEKPRPGKPPVLSKREECEIVAMVCSDPPEGRAQWSVRLITKEAIAREIVPSVGRETIRLVLTTHDLKPWRKKNVVCSKPD
jgi:putative transposase